MRTKAAVGFATILFTASIAAVPALAQQSAPAQSSAPAGTPPANSNLVVASVKVDSGWRVGKVMGQPVYNDQDAKIGTVDDLIVGTDNKINDAILSVGGFLGVGGKLVAVPYDQLRIGSDMKVTMPGATKDALAGMPSFTYGG